MLLPCCLKMFCHLFLVMQLFKHAFLSWNNSYTTWGPINWDFLVVWTFFFFKLCLQKKKKKRLKWQNRYVWWFSHQWLTPHECLSSTNMFYFRTLSIMNRWPVALLNSMPVCCRLVQKMFAKAFCGLHSFMSGSVSFSNWHEHLRTHTPYIA